MAVLKKIKFGESTNNIAKTVVQGKPEGVIAVTNTTNYQNTDSEDKDYSYDIDVRVDDATIVKDGQTNKVLKVGTVPAVQVSVADSDGVFTAENVETALKELKDNIAEVGGAAKSYTIIEKTTGLPTNVAHRYKLQQTIGEGATAQVTEVGENIDILKDNSLLAAKLSTMDATWDAEEEVIVDGTGKQALVLVYLDADGAAQVIHIDVSAFLNESEFKDGLAVSANGEVSAKLGQGLEFGGETGENQSIKVKVDSTSESFLTVGANGVKISGVQDAITAAIEGLDVTDAEVTGKYVSQVSETDGKISVARQDVSGAKLNNYAKGTDELPLAATDTINEAFSKIEVSIVKNEKVTATALNEINTKINGMDKAAAAVDGQVVTTVSEADGVVSETKANVKDLQLGGYAKDASAKSPIGGTDTINTALSKLENAIDAATTKVVEGTDAGNNLEISSATSQTDGSTTYTINLTDVASKTALDAEIAARKAVDGQSGDTYAANANANYISAATSLNDADVKLDAALKAEETRAKSAETAIDGAVGLTKDASGEGRTYTNTGEYIGKETSNTVASDIKALDTQLKAVTDKVNAIQYKVTGTTLEFFEISEKTGA